MPFLRLCVQASCLAVALSVLGDCAYPVRNGELEEGTRVNTALGDAGTQGDGYRGTQVYDPPYPETLVVLTVSGGGTRASALGYGAMRAMRDVRFGDGGTTLLDAVDIVSSVSGGSVPAAYLALRGPAGIDDFRERFLLSDGMAALIWGGLNPYGLASLSSAGVERIDLLIDHFDNSLFAGATYADLRDPRSASGWKRPYLILNAADMAAEAPFPFHQWQFDLLCSDLETLPLSVAVAASAAFPAALSPVTLRNYSEPGGCPGQRALGSGCLGQQALGSGWPPCWVTSTQEAIAAGELVYDNPGSVRRARLAAGYYETRAGALMRPYVHLLDGGLADNLGLAEPLRLMTSAEIEPRLFSNFFDSAMSIQDVLVVVVNARSDPDSDLDAEVATPGMIDMLTASISSAIDNATFGTQGRLALQIRELIREAANLDGMREDLRANMEIQLSRLDIQTAMIDFDYITNDNCRRLFQNIATTWTLEAAEVDALIDLSGALLWKDPGFRNFLQRQRDRGVDVGPSWDEGRIAAAETAACGRLALHAAGAG